MKSPSLVYFLFCLLPAACAQKKSAPNQNEMIMATTQDTATPDQLYGKLFDLVQMKQVFADGKTFVDCTPKRAVKEIMYDFGMQYGEGMDLKKFVSDNFNLPEVPPTANVQPEKDIAKHIKNLWPLLTRQPASQAEGSTLLALPHPYIVPGGRFREIYYWDSYFTMLGLKESGEMQIIEDMVKNFAFLINTYGHIPNGNRNYYLSRSQPPFFSMMVDLLAQVKGDDIYGEYLDVVEKEYMYWMAGDKEVKPGEALHRVVKMPDGELMNRYWDDLDIPRQESYREDVETATEAVTMDMARIRFTSKEAMEAYRENGLKKMYRHLRAGAASGWDFSSRWFADGENIQTIETADIIPVDLNSLLYFTETLLSKMYSLKGNKDKAANFEKWANEREAAINKYCYNNELTFYTDYQFNQRQPVGRITAAGMYPFCFFNPDKYKDKAEKAAGVIKAQLLASGGVLTSPVASGQQWDAPNGWAPLQWMTTAGLERNGQQAMAKDIAVRWIKLNKEVFARTGKMMEKYNVVNTTLDAGGGEYPGQDGFGWTNGVLLAMMKKYE